MKTIRSSIILALLFLIQHSGFSQSSNGTFVVRAWIDGTSRLVVNSNSVYWDHLVFHQPGRTGGNFYPTYLDGFPWNPQWPRPDDEVGVSCIPLPVITSFNTTNVTLSAIASRGNVQIIQQPNSTNGQTLIVEFDDGPNSGADWYEIQLAGLAVEFNSPLSIQVASVALNWFAKVNRLYQPQYTTNFQAPDWTALGPPIQGTGSNTVVTDNIVNPARFYRVIILP